MPRLSTSGSCHSAKFTSLVPSFDPRTSGGERRGVLANFGRPFWKNIVPLSEKNIIFLTGFMGPGNGDTKNKQQTPASASCCLVHNDINEGTSDQIT